MYGLTQEQASDPGTPPAVLVNMIEHRPDLRAAVAMNPALPPYLRQRLAAFGDPAIDAALAGIRGPMSSQPVAPQQPAHMGVPSLAQALPLPGPPYPQQASPQQPYSPRQYPQPVQPYPQQPPAQQPYPPQSQQYPPAQQPYPQPLYPQPPSLPGRQVPRKGKAGVIVAVITVCVLVLGLGGAAAWFFLGRDTGAEYAVPATVRPYAEQPEAKWEAKPPNAGVPDDDPFLVGMVGEVWIGYSYISGAWALDANDGSLIWADENYTGCQVDGDSVFCQSAGDPSTSIVELDPKSGSVLSTIEVGGRVFSFIARDGVIYLPTMADGAPGVSAFDMKGATLWSTELFTGEESTNVAVPNLAMTCPGILEVSLYDDGSGEYRYTVLNTDDGSGILESAGWLTCVDDAILVTDQDGTDGEILDRDGGLIGTFDGHPAGLSGDFLVLVNNDRTTVTRQDLDGTNAASFECEGACHGGRFAGSVFLLMQEGGNIALDVGSWTVAWTLDGELPRSADGQRAFASADGQRAFASSNGTTTAIDLADGSTVWELDASTYVVDGFLCSISPTALVTLYEPNGSIPDDVPGFEE